MAGIDDRCIKCGRTEKNKLTGKVYSPPPGKEFTCGRCVQIMVQEKAPTKDEKVAEVKAAKSGKNKPVRNRR